MKINQLNPIIIISPGRSGSTLLQRYLNLSDKLIIWGEHAGFISGLAQMYSDFIEDAAAQRNIISGLRNVDLIMRSQPITNRGIEWTNNFTSDVFLNGIRDFLINLFSKDVDDQQRWGFKEIRYLEKEYNFISDLFPDVQFIFLVRNPLDTLASMIAAREKDKWPSVFFSRKSQKAIIEKYANRILERISAIYNFSKEKQNFIIIRYEDLVKDPQEVLDYIFKFLGVATPEVQKIELISNSYLSVMEKDSIKHDINKYHRKNKVFKELSLVYENIDFFQEGL
ncbi:MAG: hypothetical protein CVU39_04000 [Chloroflexi bacterium HGW-Chloroflexi-10]|nr:MAG: hypothetical protein CVU39_04000 [Chloroflexi bacterium HGW-Chloroflexi-10]